MILGGRTISKGRAEGRVLKLDGALSFLGGVDASTGSLGQGCSIAVGMALGAKILGKDTKVYALLGDGECQEGQIWEAFMAAAHHKLDNLTVIIDNNGLQFDGRKEDILKPGDPAARWASLGYSVCTVNGHDVEELQAALLAESDKPKVIIAKTVKGKGVHFAENDVTWHTGRLTDELYQEAIRDIND